MRPGRDECPFGRCHAGCLQLTLALHGFAKIRLFQSTASPFGPLRNGGPTRSLNEYLLRDCQENNRLPAQPAFLLTKNFTMHRLSSVACATAMQQNMLTRTCSNQFSKTEIPAASEATDTFAETMMQLLASVQLLKL